MTLNNTFFDVLLQQTDFRQPMVGVVRSQDFAVLLLQRGQSAYGMASASRLRYHPSGQIAGQLLSLLFLFCGK